MTLDYYELVSLIPTCIEPEFRLMLKQQVDQTLPNRDSEWHDSSLDSEDLITVLWGLDLYRRHLTSCFLPWQFLNCDQKILIPKIIHIGKTTNIPIIIYEVLVILRISGQVKLVIENQGLLLFIQFLRSTQLIISNEALRGIQNILENHTYVKFVQQLNVIPILLQIIEKNETQIELGVNILIRLCDEYKFERKGKAGLNLMKNVLDTFCKQIQEKSDQLQITKLSFDVITKLISQSSESQKYLVETGFIKYCIGLMRDYKEAISDFAFTILWRNIIQGMSSQVIQYILEQDFFGVILMCSKFEKFEGKQYQILQILFKLRPEQKIQYIIRNKEFTEQLFLMLKTQDITHSEIRILDFISDIIPRITLDGISLWIDQGFLSSLLDIIKLKGENKSEIKTVIRSLYLVDLILYIGHQEEIKTYAIEFKRNNGINLLDRLQQYSNKEIAEVIANIQRYL